MLPKLFTLGLLVSVPFSSAIVAECPSEPTQEICGNGFDDDGNGYTDCDDFACYAESYCEGNSSTCSDGVDNDGNGYADCEDFACSLNCNTTDVCGENESSFEACSDGLDNDGNGYIDCDDWSCTSNACAEIRDYCYEVLTGAQ